MSGRNPNEELRCTECRMLLCGWAEFHPLEACRLYAKEKNAEHVRRVMAVRQAELFVQEGGSSLLSQRGTE